MGADRLEFRVNLALSEADVLATARGFVESVAPELTRLAEAYRPQRITTAADIFYWAYALDSTNVAFQGASADAALMQELSTFFKQAAARLNTLRSWSREARSAFY
jgi:hypothetical protein